jgi:hypothetical protein
MKIYWYSEEDCDNLKNSELYIEKEKIIDNFYSSDVNVEFSPILSADSKNGFDDDICVDLELSIFCEKILLGSVKLTSNKNNII